MRRIPAALVFGAFTTLPAPAVAQNAGYQELWAGYAAITTCRQGQDAYKLGSYVFACAAYGYPYHYGDVVLLARSLTVSGRAIVMGRLCLAGSDVCFEGQIYSAAGLQSAREVTRECQDARGQVDYSVNRLEGSTSSFRTCVQASSYDDECASEFQDITSSHQSYGRDIRAAKDACE